MVFVTLCTTRLVDHGIGMPLQKAFRLNFKIGQETLSIISLKYASERQEICPPTSSNRLYAR